MDRTCISVTKNKRMGGCREHLEMQLSKGVGCIKIFLAGCELSWCFRQNRFDTHAIDTNFSSFNQYVYYYPSTLMCHTCSMLHLSSTS